MSQGKPPPKGGQDKAALENFIDRLQRHMKELKAVDANSVRDQWDTRLEVLQKKVNNSLGDILGVSTPEYKQYKQGTFFHGLDTTFGDRYSTEELQQALKKGLAVAVTNLDSVRKMLAERLEGSGAAAPAPAQAPPPPPPPPATPAPTPAPTQAPTPAPTQPPTPAPTQAPPPPPAATKAPPPAATPAPTRAPQAPAPSTPGPTKTMTTANNRVALVGPLDDTASQASELLDQLGLEAVVVGKPSGSKDAISLEALEGLRDVGYAIVMSSGEGDSPTAFLTLGFLLAVLGRGRLCFLAPPSQTSFPTLGDAVRVTTDEAGLWRLLMAREMKKAGLDVDLNKAI